MSTLSDSGPPAAVDIVHRDVDGILVVEVTGEIDLESAPAVHAAVLAAIDHTAGEPCILDLTAVTFLSSAGLTALLDATTHAEKRREPLRIVVDSNRPVIRPIEITGLDGVLKLYHTVDEALNAGAGP
ncbi:anti-sigma factor antagonist [Actinokineospora sp. NPDC004072]